MGRSPARPAHTPASLVGALLLGASAVAMPAAAQEQASPAAEPGAIIGVAFDSLLMKPLVGANVFVPAAGRGTLTDSAGHFRVDSVPPGMQFVAVSHPALDAIGLTTLGAEVPVRSADSVRARIATPSLHTLRQRACGMDLPEEPPGVRIFGLVFGSVGSARDGARLAGATVHARWLVADSLGGGPVRVGSAETETQTDATGNYYFCDVPVNRPMWIYASGGDLASQRTEVFLDARGVARHDLLLVPADSAVAATLAPATIVGVVRDTGGRPIPNSRILVDGVSGETVSDSAGRFAIAGVPAGSRMLEARVIGMSPIRRAIAATPGDTLQLDLLAGGGVILEPVTVRARAVALGPEMRGFEERRRLGRGLFFDSTDVRVRGSLRALASSLPTALLEGTFTRWEPVVTGQNGGMCVPSVWVDGRLTDWEEVSTLTAEVVQAVEYYQRPNWTPQRFHDTRNQLCGTAVIWTVGVR